MNTLSTCKGVFERFLAQGTGVTLGTKYREPNTEPKLPRTEPKLPKLKYSVPISVLSFQEPNYWDKYLNRTKFTKFTELTWNVISLSVVILLIVLL